MTNPMRESFLSNLKVTNPEAFTKVAEYMGNTNAEAATRLKLPAPKPLGSAENPIVTAPPTTFESPAQNINREKYINVKSNTPETKLKLEKVIHPSKLPTIKM